MKTKFLIIVLTTIIGIFYACSKKDTDDEIDSVSAKLQGKWMITSYVDDLGQETYSSMPACEKDNVITYDKYTVSVDEGFLKCDSTDPQSFSSSYALKGNGIDILTYVGTDGDDLDDMQIIFIDDTTLKLKDAVNNGIITYTKIPKIIVYSQVSIVGKWKMNGIVANGVDVWNLPLGTCLKGTNGSCTYSIPACLRDDTQTFTSDNKFLGDEGLTKCAITNPQSVSGVFTLDGQKSQIMITYAGSTKTYNIILINSTALILRQVGNANSDYEMYQRL